ncbi:MAG: Ig-like domain-containing protein, partial [Actinomycetia bacterium]|nr:Ig-like domain-containing protein [Actinomycetes bacterium]
MRAASLVALLLSAIVRVPSALRRTLMVGIAVALAITFYPLTASAETLDPGQGLTANVMVPATPDPEEKPPSGGEASGPVGDAPAPADVSGPAGDPPGAVETPHPAGDEPAPDEPAAAPGAPAAEDDSALQTAVTLPAPAPQDDAPASAEEPAAAESGPSLAPMTAPLGSGLISADASWVDLWNGGSSTAGDYVTVSVRPIDDGGEWIDWLDSGEFVVQATAPGRPTVTFSHSKGAMGDEFEAVPLLAGQYTITVTVSGVTLTTQPTLTVQPGNVCRWSCAPVDPANVTRAEVIGDGKAADGVAAVTVVVRAFDFFGNPVPGAPVLLGNVSSGWLFDTLTPADTFIRTGSDGTASQSFRAVMAGTYELGVAVNGNHLDRVRLTFVEPPVGPDDVTISITSPAQAGQTVSAQITAVRSDSQPVTVPIGLTEPTGNVEFLGECVLDNAGTCLVDLVATRVGTYTIGVTAGGVAFKGATANVTVVPGPVWTGTCVLDDRCTRVEVDRTSAPADGITPVVATAWVFDQYGNPVPGVEVEFMSMTDFLPGAHVQTDDSGRADAPFTSTKVGSEYFYPVIAETFMGFVEARFTLAALDVDGATVTVSPDRPTVGTKATLRITLTDINGNPATGQSVDIAATGLVIDDSCETNRAGKCTVDIYSETAGTFDITASVGGQPLANGSVQVTYDAGPVWTGMCVLDDRCTRAEVTKDGATANDRDTNVVTVWAYDLYGNPVKGETVTLRAYDWAVTIVDDVQLADAGGRADFAITSTGAASFDVEARFDSVGGPGPYTTVTFTPGPVDPDQVWLMADERP